MQLNADLSKCLGVNERASLLKRIKHFENLIRDAQFDPRNSQYIPIWQAERNKLKNEFDRRTPKLNAKEKDELAKRKAQLEEELSQVMLTKTEMNRGSNEDVSRNLEFKRLHEHKAHELKQICRAIEPENELSQNVERLRK